LVAIAAGVIATPIACLPGQYRSGNNCANCAPGTFSTVRNAISCTAHKNCQKGQFVKLAPTSSSNRLCISCVNGKYSDIVNAPSCSPFTVCTAGVKQTKRPTSTSDRVCESQSQSQWKCGVQSSFDSTAYNANFIPGGIAFAPLGPASCKDLLGVVPTLKSYLYIPDFLFNAELPSDPVMNPVFKICFLFNAPLSAFLTSEPPTNPRGYFYDIAC